MTLTVAVDGSALGNPGPAGWAWVVSPDQWDAGGWDYGTNNLGELTAVQQILLATQAAGMANEPLHILADSQYAINVVTKWMHGWKKRGWTKADKKPIANLELIQDIDRLIAGRPVTFEWVRGHAGHSLNELADDHAREAATLHQAGSVAPGGPGLRLTPVAEGGVAADPPASLARDARLVQTPEAYPAIATPPSTHAPNAHQTQTSGSGPAATTLPSTHTPKAHSTHPSNAEDILSVGAIRAGQRRIIRAWLDGDDEVANENLAPDFERVWPDGQVTATFSGPRPPQADIGTLNVLPAGNTLLVTYTLTWPGGKSIEASLWAPSPDGPRLVHHQSTPTH